MKENTATINEPLCLICIHKIGWEWGKCSAYPEGIPKEILDGTQAHFEPYKDDFGITFKPYSDVSKDDSYLEEHNVGRDEKGRFVRAGGPFEQLELLPGLVPGSEDLSKLPPTDVPKGYKRQEGAGYIQYADLPKFKTKDEARKWFLENMGLAVDFDTGTDLDNINATFEALRVLDEHAPLKNKIDAIGFGYQNIGAAGTMWESWKRGEAEQEGSETGVVAIGKDLSTFNRDYVKTIKKSIKYKEQDIKTYETNIREYTKRQNSIKPEDRDSPKEFKKVIDSNKGLISELRGQINTLNEQLKSGRVRIPFDELSMSHELHKNDAAGVMTHEYGHLWHWQNRKKVKKHFGQGWDREFSSRYLRSHSNTDYATANWRECFAENFTSYMAGETDRTAPDFIVFFDKQFPTLNFGQTNKKGRRQRK